MKRTTSLTVIALVAVTTLFTHAEERYTVIPGDSLSKIGRQFGIPYREIMEANQLLSHRIAVGQILVIPNQSGNTAQAAKPVAKENKAIPPLYDRYRSPALTESTIEPMEPVVSPTRVGLPSGEVPLIPEMMEEQKPEAFAKPRHTYPQPSQQRYSAPTSPGSTSISPYNDSPSTASRTQPDSNPSVTQKSSTSSKRGRTVPASAKIGSYMVQPGDTVRSISKRHGITSWQLRSSNSLGLRKIYPGQMLKIPNRSSRLR